MKPRRFSAPPRPDRMAVVLLVLFSIFAVWSLVWEIPRGDYSSVYTILLSAAVWTWTIWAWISHRYGPRSNATEDDAPRDS